MRRRWIGLCLSLIFGLLLIVALFFALGASSTMLIDGIRHAPWWMFALTIGITFLNKIVGALKWQNAAAWLTPDAPRPSVYGMVELTALGSFLGQVLPIQITSAAVRWFAAKRDGRAGGWAVGSTLYEQLFDLVILVSAGLVGVFIFTFEPSWLTAAAMMVAVLALSIVLLRSGFSALEWICARFQRRYAGLAQVSQMLSRAKVAPLRVILSQAFWSSLRLLLMIGRTLAVAIVFLPGIDPLLVAAGYPAAGLSMALPIAPAGLGLAEWTWSGLLILAGAAPAAAAITAIGFRLVNFISLAVVLAALAVVRGLSAITGR